MSLRISKYLSTTGLGDLFDMINMVLSLGLVDFNKEDLGMLSEGEIRELTASVYIFLTKFGSTALAKQFVTVTKEIQPKDQTQ